MIISGLQRLTLLDYPGKVACTVFTGGCGFRCPFCHNASLVLSERGRDTIPVDEVMGFLKKRHGLLDGVAVTGGEPLIHEDIAGFLEKIRAIGYKIKLDTNGAFPERLRRLIASGLVDRVAMDIKSSPEGYARAVGIPDFDIEPVKESAEILLAGDIDYEFRTTAVKGLHEKRDFEAIGRWIAGAQEYYIQGFRDSGDLISPGGLGAFTREETDELAETVRPFVPSVKIRGID